MAEKKNLVWMFPGQGSQSVGMGRELYDQFPLFKRTFEEASDALNLNMAKLCFEDPENQINLTEYTQPAILTVSTGIWRILEENAGAEPTYVAGHSLGEYSALVASKALNFSDAVKAVRFRGQSMQQAVPVGVGAMAAYLGSKAEELLSYCRDISKPECVVEVVNFNSPQQLVLSGHKGAIEAACAHITAQKWGRAIPLPVSAPFHSSLMQPAAMMMEEYLKNVPLDPVEGTIVANVDANAYGGTQYRRTHLIKQLASAVLWTQSLQRLNDIVGEETKWIEVGPGAVLQGLVKKTLEGRSTAGTADLTLLKALLEG